MTTFESSALTLLQENLPLRQLPWQTGFREGEFPEAGVLVALTNESAPRVVLGRRGLHLPTHPGEVAFPGGKRELEDASPWATAMREAHEEVGLMAAGISPIGELDPLITRTGFKVYPCVAVVAPELELTVDPAEFDSVFTPQLAVFGDAELFRLEVMFDGQRNRKVPHYQIEQDNVWGVTAAILAQLANVAYDAALNLQRNWNEKP